VLGDIYLFTFSVAISASKELGSGSSEIHECVWTLSRTFGQGFGPTSRPLLTHRTTQHKKTRTRIHASSGIRIHDPCVRAVEDSTCLRQRGHWDRLMAPWVDINII
jgi:hypothetical protein